jgi:serine/threonine protein kinase
MTTKIKELAVGLDGCVYKPAFTCKEGRKYPLKNYISKLMRKGEAKMQEEIENYRKLRLTELDPDMEYFISNPEACSLTDEDIDNFHKAKKDCNNVATPLKAVNYIDGGKDMYSLFENIININDNGGYVSLNDIDKYFDAFDNIIKGVALLNENGVYHLDIKPENIVFMETPETYPNFKLIDFGLSRHASNPPKHTFGTPPYIPPEMYMFAGNGITLRENYSNYFSRTVPTMNIPINEIPPINYYEKMPDETKFVKADVWALGMILYEMYSTIMVGPYEEARLEIYTLLKNRIIDPMLDTNVNDRLSIQEVKEMYNDFMIKLAEYPADPQDTILAQTSPTTSGGIGGIRGCLKKKSRKTKRKVRKYKYAILPPLSSKKKKAKRTSKK